MSRRRGVACGLVFALGLFPASARAGLTSITVDDIRAWLTYIASDQLEGRATYSAGLGLAAGFIQDHLEDWRLRPAGDNGSFLQTVSVRGVRTTSRSTVTVRIGNETRTFADGDAFSLPRNQGGKRTFTVARLEFAGYGLDIPGGTHADYGGRDVRDAVVVWLGAKGPKAADSQLHRRLLAGRHRYAVEQMHAAASIGPGFDNDDGSPERPAAPQANAERGPAVDFTSAQRLDAPVAPRISASDAFLEFLFSRSPVLYADLKRRVESQEALAPFTLDGVTMTFAIDADYEVVRTQLTHNLVGIVEGSDPVLRNSYVAFGAHYDHVGYAETDGTGQGRRPGRVTAGADADRIWNGADDNGSGTVALMALARAFAEGPRPKRSLLFVWHAGEERGLWGSHYFVDHPTVPLDAIVAQLNVDMVGRNRNDDAREADTVYLVGSDRISSELHEINRQANRGLARPFTLNYELNDPTDLEQFYFRSDHYSYALKGIPIIFFTTGLHSDYHANTDHVSKIEFEKLVRVAGLIYETGARVANLDHAPSRDNRGPRAGKGTL